LSAETGRHRTAVVYGAIAAGVALLIGANAHLLYVAFSSQPECVDHLRLGNGEEGRLAAARSSCVPQNTGVQP